MSSTISPRKEILDKLFEMAREGDVRAAKIYLDCTRDEAAGDSHALSVEETIKLIRDMQLAEGESEFDFTPV